MKSVASILLVTISLAISGCSELRATKLLNPAWFGMEEIAPDIYVDKDMSTDARGEFQSELELAKERVSHFFGSLTTHPEIFCCSTEGCYKSFGGSTSKGKAFGDKGILMSPRGIDVIFLSHELSHIELHHRIGELRSWKEVPAWFDEGLAVLVSQDPRYTEKIWRKETENGNLAPQLTELESNRQWLRAVKEKKWAYGTARREVENWYQKVGAEGLHKLIEKVKADEDFHSAYKQLLDEAMPSNKANTADVRTSRG